MKWWWHHCGGWLGFRGRDGAKGHTNESVEGRMVGRTPRRGSTAPLQGSGGIGGGCPRQCLLICRLVVKGNNVCSGWNTSRSLGAASDSRRRAPHHGQRRPHLVRADHKPMAIMAAEVRLPFNSAIVLSDRVVHFDTNPLAFFEVRWTSVPHGADALLALHVHAITYANHPALGAARSALGDPEQGVTTGRVHTWLPLLAFLTPRVSLDTVYSYIP